MYPPEFIKRIYKQKYLDAEDLLQSLNKPAPVSIRINREKWGKIPLHSDWVPWCEQGYYLDARPSFTSDPLFHSGCYYPQEASSMFIGEILRQIQSDINRKKVLDLCAAPGGKSTHLSSLIGKDGLLVANEVIRSRAAILAENITKWGAGNTIVTNNDPSAFSSLEEYFDVILVDAPCSGEGMFFDKSVRKEWSSENAMLCADRQRRILMDSWPSLKEGGSLIYSTCTFNPAENEENIKWFTDKTASETITLDLSGFTNVHEIRHEGITGYGFYPGKVKGEGFFCSVIKKPGIIKDDPAYSSNKLHNPITTAEIKIAERLVECNPNHFYRTDDIVYALSLPFQEFQYLQKYLRIIKGGTALFKSRKEDFTPFHDLSLSYRIREDAFASYEIDYEMAIKFLRKDAIVSGKGGQGWIVLKYNGVNLGFGKNIGLRMNNYFPVEWRIRLSESAISGLSRIKWME